MSNGYNWYVYGANNPIMFTDPSGLIILIDTTAEGTPDDFIDYICGLVGELTGYKATYDPELGIQLDTSVVVNEGDFTESNELVNDLINNGVTTIKYGSSWTCAPESIKNSYEGTPTGAIIIAYPDQKSVFTTIDSNGNIEETLSPSYINLAHEFSHAQGCINGTAGRGSRDFQYLEYKDGDWWIMISDYKVDTEELIATGIIYNNIPDKEDGPYEKERIKNQPLRISENDIRVEHGNPQRINYPKKEVN